MKLDLFAFASSDLKRSANRLKTQAIESKFYDDVVIKYNDQVIKCDNLDLKISDNIAIAYNNVIFQDRDSLMKAEKITMNILTKDIIINSDNKIEITTN